MLGFPSRITTMLTCIGLSTLQQSWVSKELAHTSLHMCVMEIAASYMQCCLVTKTHRICI